MNIQSGLVAPWVHRYTMSKQSGLVAPWVHRYPMSKQSGLVAPWVHRYTMSKQSGPVAPWVHRYTMNKQSSRVAPWVHRYTMNKQSSLVAPWVHRYTMSKQSGPAVPCLWFRVSPCSRFIRVEGLSGCRLSQLQGCAEHPQKGPLGRRERRAPHEYNHRSIYPFTLSLSCTGSIASRRFVFRFKKRIRRDVTRGTNSDPSRLANSPASSL